MSEVDKEAPLFCSQCGKSVYDDACGPTHALMLEERKVWDNRLCEDLKWVCPSCLEEGNDKNTSICKGCGTDLENQPLPTERPAPDDFEFDLTPVEIPNNRRDILQVMRSHAIVLERHADTLAAVVPDIKTIAKNTDLLANMYQNFTKRLTAIEETITNLACNNGGDCDDFRKHTPSAELHTVGAKK